MSLRIKLWGIRGSLSAPHTPSQLEQKIKMALKGFGRMGAHADVDFFLSSLPLAHVGGYGGHTSCVQVSSPGGNLIIDGGTGLRAYGDQFLLSEEGRGSSESHLFFTHFHWDHLMGLPFFTPIYKAGNTIHVYAVQREIEEIFHVVFKKPFFPVPFKELPAQFHFHILEPRTPISFKDMTITPYKLDHPDPCWGFRIESHGKVYSHCVDNESQRVSQKDLGADLPFFQNVDAMLFDAQYTFREAAEKINWGHSSAPIGIDLALRENIKRIYFVHHDPGATDDDIFGLEIQTREYFEACRKAYQAQNKHFPELHWEFAREGMTIEL